MASLAQKSGGPVGAYGMRIEGLGEARSLLVPASRSWPLIEVVHRLEQGPFDELDHLGDHRAQLWLQTGGRIEVDRHAGRAVVVTPRPLTDNDLVHPFLAPVASVIARWHGRTSFHAGAFAIDGAVWGVLGDSSAGKSSLLATLAGRGVGIVTDDILVVDHDRAFLGPRAIDLREDVARTLRLGEPLGMVGARERWRHTLPQVDGDLRIRGWISLEWGDQFNVARLAPGSRALVLDRSRAVRLAPDDPDEFLRLASLPGWKLTRPSDLRSLGPAADHLLEVLPA
jgi:hypothetical protein